jgi:RimJ/RimL family protein N-acetyltransferase
LAEDLMNVPLFENRQIYLAAPDPERDAEVISRWTHDPALMRLMEAEPARPLSPGQAKKRLESAVKDGTGTRFEFMIRRRSDDRLVGSARISGILWTHRSGRLEILIGNPDDRGRGYGREALDIVLRFAFDELNLYRLAAATCAYNRFALRWLEQTGFVIETRQREAIERDGQRWDLIQLALLRPEWKAVKGIGGR